MKQEPLVSIALCTYNGAKYLAPQLDTLINQTYKNIEIIVVDDCSTDDTFAILTDYGNRYPQFKIFRNDLNIGFILNFEKAVTFCTGKLIALCDQDDLWHTQKIELQVKAIKHNIFIYHDSEFINKDGSKMNKKVSDIMNFYRGGNPDVFLLFNCVSGHSILMKRELLEKALPLKEGFFHDWWLAFVATNIGEIDYLPQCLVKYRQHDASETNILQLSRSNEIYKLSSRQILDRNIKWLAHCSKFEGGKNIQFRQRIYNAYKQRENNGSSLGLSRLLFKNRQTIFFIRKKSSISKLNYIWKQSFG